MNDQQQPYDPYGPYYTQPQIVGYDEYGQPVYQQSPQQQYDAYGQPVPQQQQTQQQQGYGYDPYAQQQEQQQAQQQQAQQQQIPQQYDPYAQQVPQQQAQQQQAYGYDPYGYDTGQQQAQQQAQQPQQAPGQQQQAVPEALVAVDRPPAARTPEPAPAPAPASAPAEPARGAEPEQPAVPGQAAVPGQRRPDGEERDYRTEQFAFIEEPTEDSEDVIDWLKFTESRSERREEAKRRGRSRVVALVVALALAVTGGVGYLWYAGELPGMSSSDAPQTTASGTQKRDVIVVHLRSTKQKDTSTALLVNNSTTGQGTTVLLPNVLSIAGDEGASTTLGKSVDEDGSDGTREGIGTLLGTKIAGTWRLDTPYLENLVELVGGIEVTTDVEVPAAKKGDDPLVPKGEKETLNGRAAVGYATYRAPGEEEAKQLTRFGQVLQGVLRKISDDPGAATVTVETLAQILDPSLTEKDLGAALAKLAEHAKVGDYKTTVLPVQTNGTLSEESTESVVKDILGGSVTAPEQGDAVRVGVKNASGNQDAAESARIALVNGGYSFVDAGTADAVTSSRVTYGDAAKKEQAEETAKTLGLPASAVEKGKAAANADVSVVLGQDYKVD
ncbi:LCP family protein [Streptomyces sp. JV176]|uniref:LCP family protein n=1 Tax=Streptomyces sp. JV176 TaxID=858630 RepID=UPI002E789A74|nr:LCP family protein [Streptomyces sp. JV176]MEE1802632.1 LCP family protein [Streptomyces sp. JV176]